ncbi:MAG TPA: bifunctional diaminohydroxyphosphoribosylaminopyrimidine deaminase/5-amino-6-(5-phosphoribosylamino)uracil reductase RibD [Actinomycetota bacterium]|nr:bifunctional diaminohydroxyphosphoribosylaminopyrimidine deaminase/5-amino-6-(5-phosphoribosylamino)uracil reductase RibD [Actinomycetota bacterium]
MSKTDDGHFMRRTLELARSAAPPSPNPRVGAVLVRDGAVVSEGVHRGPGAPHAEVDALDALTAPAGVTCYVNLEPCVHHGRTPPCARALVAAGVARVVAAIRDPDPRVDGDGFAYLEDHGVEVVTGVLAGEARELNAAYIHHRTTGRPLVTLKLALTLDGRLGAPDGSARWITSPETRTRVHQRRAQADAVMVGAGTVLADDPCLTARNVGAKRQPLRIVLDASGRISPSANVFDDPRRTVVATTGDCPHEVQLSWKETGADVVVVPPGADGGVDVDALIRHLGERDVLDLICEGGAELGTTLLRLDLVDRLEIHYGPVVAGRGGPDIGDLGVTSMTDAHRWSTVGVERSGPDAIVLLERLPD